eukprot:CAMPEP_0119386360 /NCGR_PEP_ID=MMETSP1334-20130426/95732_1 /TAXON_ID=127549 /ORGANISM="Calcidiscus leptoporus, Strain RCC1130" /LENGTH=69 /DNA_ID=CAMNT_0007407855 /DNA_START=173 /DNA_END=379 /DNA_ORIENTATION=-
MSTRLGGCAPRAARPCLSAASQAGCAQSSATANSATKQLPMRQCAWQAQVATTTDPGMRGRPRLPATAV